jgi:hypothetical protein
MSDAIHFTPDRDTYIRNQIRLAAIAMAAAMAVLWLIGDSNIWVGAVAGLAAIALRGWYLASEELAAVWTLQGRDLSGPGGRHVTLGQIDKVRSLGNLVQIITSNGDKHLIKHLADPAAAIATIESARFGGDRP